MAARAGFLVVHERARRDAEPAPRVQEVECPRRAGPVAAAACRQCPFGSGYVHGAGRDYVICIARGVEHTETVADIMARDCASIGDLLLAPEYTIGDDASIERTAAVMASARLARLPVVSRNGVIVGVVSSLDVLRWFARRAGYVLT